MAERPAASLTGDLLVRKGAASTVGFAGAANAPAAAAGACDSGERGTPGRRFARLAGGALQHRRLVPLRLIVPSLVVVAALVGYQVHQRFASAPGGDADGAAPPAVATPVPGEGPHDASAPPQPVDVRGRGVERGTPPILAGPDAPQASPPPAPSAAATEPSPTRTLIPPAPSAPAASLRAARKADIAALRDKAGYRVQIYALHSEAAVRQAWRRLQKTHRDLFGDLGLVVERADFGARKAPLYRLQAGELTSAAAARRLCEKARRRKLDCLVIGP
ncbi:MAG: SPOR domain-containing protein [Alphaproteobacteria bacterium]